GAAAGRPGRGPRDVRIALRGDDAVPRPRPPLLLLDTGAGTTGRSRGRPARRRDQGPGAAGDVQPLPGDCLWVDVGHHPQLRRQPVVGCGPPPPPGPPAVSPPPPA